MKSICIFPYDSEASGIATYTAELAKALSNKGFEVHVLGFGQPRSDMGKVRNLHYHKVSDLRPRQLAYLGGNFPQYLIMNTILRRYIYNNLIVNHKIDVFHCVMPISILALKRKDLSRTIVTAWTLLKPLNVLKSYPRYFKFPMNFLVTVNNLLEAWILESLAYRRAEKIVGVTTNVVKDLQKELPGRFIKWIPPGIELPEIR